MFTVFTIVCAVVAFLVVAPIADSVVNDTLDFIESSRVQKKITIK